MIGLGLMALAAAHSCPVEHASYVLRSDPRVTVHFEVAPINDDWRQGVVVAIHGATTGRTSYWLPWYGGTDDRRHIRETGLIDRSKDMKEKRRIKRSSDLDFFVLDRHYDFLPDLPKRGAEAPAHLLIPNLDLWHSGPVNAPRDSSPRAFFDRAGCHRSIVRDRGKDVILPPVA